MYYTHEYDEEGILRCEAQVHILAHPYCSAFLERWIIGTGREYHDTAQKAARQALVEYCQMFEEDVEYTSTRFFPVPKQTTPTWCGKVWDLEKVNLKAPKYTGVSTVRYLHALDSLYEDQQQELSAWIARLREAREEQFKTTMELYKANQKKAILMQELDTYRQEAKEALQQLQKKRRARRTRRGRKTITRRPIAAGTRNTEPTYDPHHPYYALDEYYPMESLSDRETIETEESIADNFRNNWDAKDAGPSHGRKDADEYARELYKLQESS